MRVLAIAMLLLSICSTSSWAATNVLVVYHSTVSDTVDASAGLVPKLQAKGYTVTQEDSGALPADISSYAQVWDLRANEAITAAEETQYVNYLAAGGNAFIMGENTGFGTSRNTTVESLISALGGGSISVEDGGSDTQTINSPWNGKASSIKYPSAGYVASAGTGTFITYDAGTAYGSAIAFDPGTMTNAMSGRMCAVFDVNFLQAMYHSNPAHPGCEELTDALIGYLGGTLSSSSTPVPALNEWGILVMALLLGAATLVVRRRRRV